MSHSHAILLDYVKKKSFNPKKRNTCPNIIQNGDEILRVYDYRVPIKNLRKKEKKKKEKEKEKKRKLNQNLKNLNSLGVVQKQPN